VRSRLLIAALLFIPAAVAAQERPGLFDCEGCESIHEHSFDDLSWSTVVAPPGEPGDKLVIDGRVYKTDGKTPAEGVIVYIHHTNAKGLYPQNGSLEGWGRRHGYLRAWAKSNAKGDYRFETIRPAPYPNGGIPAHVHYIIKEPNRKEYWIDDIVFTDDPLIDESYRRRASNPRGGQGIATPTRDASGVWHVRRDIILER